MAMANRYKRQEVLESLYEKALTICDNVFTSSRPTATEKMDSFIVLRLPQGIDPYADTHNIAYVQMNCFVRDRQGGIEKADEMETLIEGVTNLIPFNDSLMSCNDAPLVLATQSDGMGFHYTIIQFKVVIKL
jgi:hypothetical protein